MPEIKVQYNNETVAAVGANSSVVLPVKDLIMLSDLSIIVPASLEPIDNWDGSGIIIEKDDE